MVLPGDGDDGGGRQVHERLHLNRAVGLPGASERLSLGPALRQSQIKPRAKSLKMRSLHLSFDQVEILSSSLGNSITSCTISAISRFVKGPPPAFLRVRSAQYTRARALWSGSLSHLDMATPRGLNSAPNLLFACAGVQANLAPLRYLSPDGPPIRIAANAISYPPMGRPHPICQFCDGSPAGKANAVIQPCAQPASDPRGRSQPTCLDSPAPGIAAVVA